MRQNYLWTLLSQLGAETCADLEKWLVWRLKGKQQYLIVLLQQLQKDPDRREVWKAMFDGRPYPAKVGNTLHPTLRKRSTALKDLIDEYLASRALKANPYLQDRLLLSQLAKLPDPQFFDKTFRQIEHKYPERDGDYQAFRYHILLEYHTAEFRRPPTKQKLRWQEMQDHLKLAASHRYMELYLAHLSNRRFLPAVPRPEQPYSFSKEMLEQQPTLWLFDQLTRLLANEPVDLDDLIQQFQSSLRLFSRNTQINIFGILLNYLLGQCHPSGAENDLIRYFRYYGWGLQQGLLLSKGVLDVRHYRNLTLAGIDAGQISIVRKYILALRDQLPPARQEAMYRLCEGLCLFAEGQFEKVKEQFASLAFPEAEFNVTVRLHFLQARYELGERAELENGIRALQTFVDSHKEISDTYKKTMRTRLKLFSRLLVAFLPDKQSKLKSDIESETSLASQKWLLAKINLLIAHGERIV